MPAFMIAGTDVSDRPGANETYAAYGRAARAAPHLEEVRYLVLGGAVHAIEGSSRRRYVVMQFPNLEAVQRWYFSDGYQAAKRLRAEISDGDLLAVDGIASASEWNTGDQAQAKKGYLIARFDVRDPEAYKSYVMAAAPAFAEHQARFLARGGDHQSLEGASRSRNVLIEFPSVDHALACYRSATYQAARRYREPISEGEVVIVEGA